MLMSGRGSFWTRVSFAASLLVASLATSTARAVVTELGNVMPLGDSITAGLTLASYVPGGYRQELSTKLTALGCSFHFVGSANTYATAELAAANNDFHEGHGGYTIQQIINGVQNANWLSVNPDIVLLHIGANDMLSADVATAPDRLDALLGIILAKKPEAKIIVAKIIGGSTVGNDSRAAAYDSAVATYNAAIAQKVAARDSLGEHVSLVDMYSLLNIQNQTNSLGQSLYSDISHPSQVGYNLMGDAWAGAIRSAVVTPEPSALTLLGTAVGTALFWASRVRNHNG
jgi:lysophospholipase L1-like esterase